MEVFIESTLRKEYKLEALDIQQLSHGQYGKSFKITTATDSYFVKIVDNNSISNANTSDFKKSIEILDFIAEHVPSQEKVKPVTSISGKLVTEVGESTLVVMPFIEGTTYVRRSEVPHDAMIKIGEYIGSFHKAMSLVTDIPDVIKTDVSFTDSLLTTFKDILSDKELAIKQPELHKRLEEMYPDTEKQISEILRISSQEDFGDGLIITHGDPSIDNWIFYEEEPLLVDWDTVMLAHPEADLHFFANDRFPEFIEGYQRIHRYRIKPELLTVYILRNQNLLLNITLKKILKNGLSDDYANDTKILNKYYLPEEAIQSLAQDLANTCNKNIYH